MTCFCALGSATAQEPAATRCPTEPTPIVGQQAPGAVTVQAQQPGCPPTHDDLSDTDKALGIALLGCAIAFASHVARGRSAKVVLS